MRKPILEQNNERAETPAEELRASIDRRFGRIPRESDPVVYEFTDDRALLHQYYRIRETMYRKVHRTDKFVGTEDVHDKIAHILVARRGKLCIGGCRLIIREGDEEFLLPMEHGDFKVRNLFPDLPLRQSRHGEISRFAVMDEDDDKLEILLALSQLIVEKCVNADMGYLFIKAPGLVMARNWRRIIAAHCGQKDVEIRSDIKVPEDPDYPEIRWQIIKTVLPGAAPGAGAVPGAKATSTDVSAKEKPRAMPITSLVH